MCDPGPSTSDACRQGGYRGRRRIFLPPLAQAVICGKISPWTKKSGKKLLPSFARATPNPKSLRPLALNDQTSATKLNIVLARGGISGLGSSSKIEKITKRFAGRFASLKKRWFQKLPRLRLVTKFPHETGSLAKNFHDEFFFVV